MLLCSKTENAIHNLETEPNLKGEPYVVVLLFYVHGKHLRSCQDGQLT